MKGKDGDPVVFTTPRGEQKEAMIVGESLNGGAKLLFSTGDEFGEGSWAYAANTPIREHDRQKNCYHHPDDPDWGEDVI